MSKRRGQKDAALDVADGDEDWLACTDCGSWVDLKTTRFGSVKEASEAQNFDCALCVRLRALAEKTAADAEAADERWSLCFQQLEAKLASTQSELEGKLEEARLQLLSEAQRREALEAQVRQLQEQRSGTRDAEVQAAGLSGVTEGRDDAVATTDPAGLAPNAHEGNGPQGSMIVSTSLHLTEVEASTQAGLHGELEPHHENGAGAPQQLETDRGRPPVSDEVGSTGAKGRRGKKRGRDSGVAGSRVTSQAGTQTLRQLSSSQQVRAQVPENSSDNSQPSVVSGREVWVFGDANAYRLKSAILCQEGVDRGVNFWTHAKATIREVAEAVQGKLAAEQDRQRLVVIHAGLTELLRGADMAEELQHLKACLGAWTVQYPRSHFLICAVPEVTCNGDSVRSKCQRWNDTARNMCREAGPMVEMVWPSRPAGEASLEGVRYSKTSADVFGVRLSRRFSSFLGHRPPAFVKSPRPAKATAGGRRSSRSGLCSREPNEVQLVRQLGQILRQLGTQI
ncbi:hypothetical protein HPB48_023880 [Haemaphysalis longicornis]|uniref:Uncharacterized protein n=1 Tax=Haemaphysalis longicornis TaxID=44386 RepID=A0A9J6H7P1_HAELO|nr:hypothetical protein HPB48_023880 [Haemaphysalis longicornis]